MTPMWWSVLLAAIGILGIWLADRKSWTGWAVGVLAQALWFAYALVTHQYGFIASAIAYATIYGWNWRKWAKTRTENLPEEKN